MTRPSAQLGFTLIEAVVVIVITGILAAVVAVFITRPVEGYFDTVRRARLTDEADTALRFIARELHSALPNSIACDPAAAPRTLSFIPIVSGARYREGQAQDGSGDPLRFDKDDVTTFDTIGGGGNATLRDAHGNVVGAGTAVIGNLGGTTPSCDATAAAPGNTVAVTGLNATGATVTADRVPQACNLQAATTAKANDRSFGRLYRTAATVAYTCGAGGLIRGGVTLSGRTSACDLACTGVNATVQTVSIRLTLGEGGESVTLFRQVHVENYP